jgi:DNA-binding GntR family transcriptional regulator
LLHRFMDTAIYRDRAFEEHQKIVQALEKGNIARAADILKDHIGRTKHFQTRVTWSTGRLRRRDYKFRDYTSIFSDVP